MDCHPFSLLYSLLYLGLTLLLVLLLKLEELKNILSASLRMIIQLLILGLWIKILFDAKYLWLLLLYIFLMVLLSSWTVHSRIRKDFSFLKILAILLLVLSSVLALGMPLVPYEKSLLGRYLIPFAGMILGNTLSALSLGIETGLRLIKHESYRIISLEGLGFGAFSSFRPVLETSLRQALTPITNTMKIVGLVSLPGLFTGQILAGADPFDAALYQIFILVLIFLSVFFGSYLSLIILYRQYQESQKDKMRKISLL